VNTAIEQERVPHITSSRAEHTARRYIGLFLLICGLIYILPFFAERLPALQRYSGSSWGLLLDHSYNLAGTDADIVIFGDSSALYGIDTPRLSATLGVKAINLPQSIGSIVVNGDIPLRRYLAQNKPPQLIVFYFSPWDLDFDAVNDPKVYEGTEQLLRHGTMPEILHMLRTNPRNLITFPLMFYRAGSSITQLWATAGQKIVPPRSGFEPYPETPYGPLPDNCVLSPSVLTQSSDQSLQRLLSNYHNTSAKTLPVLSPIPQCKAADRIAARFGPSLAIMPAKAFADDKYFAHILSTQTDASTDRLAAILRPYLETRSNAP
jgi:hypothetical protein